MKPYFSETASQLARHGKPYPVHALTSLSKGVALVAAGVGLITFPGNASAKTEVAASPTTANFHLEIDESVDYPALLDSARERAAERYANGEVGRLLFFSPESLHALKEDPDSRRDAEDESPAADALEFGEVGSAPIIDVREHVVTKSEASSESSQLRRVIRTLGSYQSGGFRPAALESALELATWALIVGVDQRISSDETRRQQLAFLASSRLDSIVSSIGNRAHAQWERPVERFIPDGALISVTLDDTFGVGDVSIQHSTGRTDFDQSAIDAIRSAAPFDEVRELQPWLRETMQTLLFSFGRPPASPEEYRRRQQAGELALFRGQGKEELDSSEHLEVDYYDRIIASIERELTVLNASRWAGELERDVELLVTLNIPLGVVMDVEVQRGSGDIHFDRVSIRAVDSASPFRGIRHLTPTQQENYRQFIVHVYPRGVR